MELKKLTTKQLTEVVNTQNNQIKSILGIFSNYIVYKNDLDGFKKFLEDNLEKNKAK